MKSRPLAAFQLKIKMILKGMLSLDTPIEKLAFVGPRNAPRLKKLGIKNIRHLLWHFPFRYEDFGQTVKIVDVRQKGEMVSITGTVTDIKNTTAWKRRMAITDAIIEDETDTIHAVWFNQPYLEKTLSPGTRVSLSGKVALDKRGFYLSNPLYEKIGEDELAHTGRLVPIFPETEGISSKYLRLLVRRTLKQIGPLADPLPKKIIKKYGFPELRTALDAIHFPKSWPEMDPARQRFAFEEILLFQLRALRDRRQLQSLKAPKIEFNKDLVSDFVRRLQFELTNDQRLATYEILKDLEKNYPMNRLLNGDVGSGKTVVALIAAVEVAAVDYQVVFMAPTEILAKQHFDTIRKCLSNKSIRVGLLTGSDARQYPSDEITKEKITKKLMRQKIARGEIDIIIGTHAVIQKDVTFKHLGLVIIDEQHRFGVEQRMKLIKSQGPVPHLLSMTATPIPRTLALTIYGDLDVSLLKEKPKGRQEIVTRVIPHTKREAAYKFVGEQVRAGRQVFVICPRIAAPAPEGGEHLPKRAGNFNTDKPLSQSRLIWSEVKAVTDEFEKLSKKIFPQLRVAMLHGKMKPKEKDKVMSDFKNKHYDLIVSTSVIEVGVDVPNASVMMIESAERFGLAQLHQFRGRVGRGEHQSYCLLFTTDSGRASYRLRALEKINNGFELAETDLKIRGPGEFTGIKQSGLPDLAMASLSDLELIKKARLEAKLLLKEDPTLKKYPTLLARLSQMQRLVHFE